LALASAGLLHGNYNKRCRNEIPHSHDLYPYAVTGIGLKFRIHPLQPPSLSLGHCGGLPPYAPGQFPEAEAFHRNTLKLPVWHREEEIPLADAYTTAFSKVTTHHRDLAG